MTSTLHSKQIEYLEILGKEKEFLSRWEISRTKNEQIISGNTLLDELIVKTINGTTVEWYNKRKHENKEFKAIRNDETIIITGQKNNEPINKTINVSTIPWFQTPGFLLKPFILSKQKSIQFLIIRTKSLTPILLEVKKIKEEPLILNNSTHTAIKTELYPPNFLKYFWKASMWFDKETGNVLKYDGLISGPGSDTFQIIYSK
ncbi:hypothetical protein DID74_02450 [Candidatus Marinamargulisbacteria bacterium SCGC AG-333-B06]|nr:hypothetical protein DID74_02450 [Candidatus Marinamargulisbacteria bacterium SCGC AG-333-B06]